MHKEKRRKADRFSENCPGEAESNSNLLFGLGAPLGIG